MKNMLIATLPVTLFAAVSPAFAGHQYEVEQDYAGWKAAREASRQAEMPKSPVILHSNQGRR